MRSFIWLDRSFARMKSGQTNNNVARWGKRNAMLGFRGSSSSGGRRDLQVLQSRRALVGMTESNSL